MKRPCFWKNSALYGTRLPEAEPINARIQAAFQALEDGDFSHRSHFFQGRYENLYVPQARIPGIRPVLRHAERCARQILAYGERPLRFGYWFNAQGPGQSTTEHSHEENDEQLSGVYYVTVPDQSGDLILLDGLLRIRATPMPGHFFFFPPALVHRVEANRSTRLRLSIAFNFGPAD